MDPRTIAELIVQLGRTSHAYVDGLTPAQWSVLRYLSRANRFSRTVSAFAEFHDTTRGTASQTVRALFIRGYLRRTRSPRDGRSVHLDLTDKARSVIPRDPCAALVRSADALPVNMRSHLATGLERLLGHLTHGRKRPFGVCTSCAYLERGNCLQEEKLLLQCSFLGEPLEEAELGQTCVNFQPSKNSAMRRGTGRL